MDRERLNALARFLRNELARTSATDDFGFAAFGAQAANEPTYSLDIDLEQLLKSVPAFERWNPAPGSSFEEKWLRLVTILEALSKDSGVNLLESPVAAEELGILQNVVYELLLHTESTLQA